MPYRSPARRCRIVLRHGFLCWTLIRFCAVFFRPYNTVSSFDFRLPGCYPFSSLCSHPSSSLAFKNENSHIACCGYSIARPRVRDWITNSPDRKCHHQKKTRTKSRLCAFHTWIRSLFRDWKGDWPTPHLKPLHLQLKPEKKSIPKRALETKSRLCASTSAALRFLKWQPSTLQSAAFFRCPTWNLSIFNWNHRKSIIQKNNSQNNSAPVYQSHVNKSWNSLGCFQKIVVPQNGWFIMRNPIKIDDLGAHYFGNTQ